MKNIPFTHFAHRISLNTMTLQVESPCVYTSQGVPISVTGIAQVKIQGQNEDMLLTACEQFLGKNENEIQHIALVTLEGHQRAIMGSMTVEEIYKDRKKFSKQVFEVASSDLVNMGITVVSYTLKDIRDEEVSIFMILTQYIQLYSKVKNYIHSEVSKYNEKSCPFFFLFFLVNFSYSIIQIHFAYFRMYQLRIERGTVYQYNDDLKKKSFLLYLLNYCLFHIYSRTIRKFILGFLLLVQ